MAKLSEIREEIKKYLRECDKIYSNHYQGSFTPEIRAMCKKVIAKFTPHVERFIRELAKENGYSIRSKFSQFLNFLCLIESVIGEAVAFRFFLRRIDLILISGLLIARSKDSADESLQKAQENHEKDLMDSYKKVLGREYPVDGTVDERAEYMIDYTAESLKPFFKIAKEEGLEIAVEKFLDKRRWQYFCQNMG